MERITSFCVDHDKIGKGIYVSRIDGDIVTYDLRTRIPNGGDYMDHVTMHSMEHMFATYIRNSEIGSHVIYFGPMGCRTGFYLLIRGLDNATVLEAIKKALGAVVSHEGEMFGNTRQECGNYRELDLLAAKREAAAYLAVLEQGTHSFAYPDGRNMDVLQDEESRLIPLWESETTYNETGMFIGKSDRFPLLFEPERILSVTSYDRQTSYRQGEDFVVTDDGCIALTEKTTIPYISEEEYYADDPESFLTTMYRGREVHTYWGDGVTMTRWQICVTYTHKPSAVSFVPSCYAERFRSVLNKLADGKDVSVLFFGDSITAGATASYYSGVTPHMPSWPALVCEYLAKRFGYTLHYVQTGLEHTCKIPKEDSVYGTRGTLNYINTAVGGWKSEHAVEHFDARVAQWLKEYDCDLFVLGFGMNDGKKTAEKLLENLRNVIDRAIQISPKLSVLAVATMLPNPLATQKWYGNQETFEEAMLAMAEQYFEQGILCAVVPMTSMSRFVLNRKRFCDCSGNNINHPNDFMIRLYAQTIIQTLIGFETK